MTLPARRLSDTELEVMQAVWVCPAPASRADINRLLHEAHPMAQTTLLTLLSRLSQKGFIRIKKEGRSARYYPLVDRQEYLANQSGQMIRRLFGGNMSAFASALCDSGLTGEEIEELRELLERNQL